MSQSQSQDSQSRPQKRRRVDDDEQVVEIKHHERLWFEDGNVVVIAKDGVSFRLHRGVLSLHSEVFRDMFTLPPNAENESMDGCPVVRVSDSGEHIARFFKLLYEGGKDPYFTPDIPVDFRTIRAMLQLSFKYEVEFIREEALRRLRFCFPSTLSAFESWTREGGAITMRTRDTIAVIDLARTFNLTDILPCAFYRCCTRLDMVQLLSKYRYGDDDCVEMSRDDLRICLQGIEKLLADGPSRARLFTHFNPPATCHRPGSCTMAITSLAGTATCKKFFTRRATLTPVDSVVDVWQCQHRDQLDGMPLCGACRSAFIVKYNEHRQKSWDSLGDIFGIKPWPIPS